MNEIQEIFSGKASVKLTESAGVQMMHFNWLKSGCTSAFATSNGRLYKPEVIDKAIAQFKHRVGENAAFGAVGHPLKGEPEIENISHQITDIGRDGEDCWAEAKLLPTKAGSTVREILKAGGQLGISLRGFGTTKHDEKLGVDLVNDDLQISGLDWCLEPASKGAVVSRKNFIGESAPVPLNPVQLDEAHDRWERAVRDYGYKHDFESYRKEFAKHVGEKAEVVEKKVEPLSQDDRIRMRYREAVKAGYAHSLGQYRRDMYPQTLNLAGDIISTKKAIQENVDENQEDIDALLKDYVSKANDPDAPEISTAIQARLDDMFEGAWVLVDHSDKLAVITWAEDLDKPKEEREYYVQPFHLTSLPQKVALHGEQTKVDVQLQLTESKFTITTKHPTEKPRRFTVRAKHAKQAAGIAHDELKGSGHEIADIKYAGEDNDTAADDSAQDQRSGS